MRNRGMFLGGGGRELVEISYLNINEILNRLIIIYSCSVVVTSSSLSFACLGLEDGVSEGGGGCDVYLLGGRKVYSNVNYFIGERGDTRAVSQP
jgi:hypothetical protein